MAISESQTLIWLLPNRPDLKSRVYYSEELELWCLLIDWMLYETEGRFSSSTTVEVLSKRELQLLVYENQHQMNKEQLQLARNHGIHFDFRIKLTLIVNDKLIPCHHQVQHLFPATYLVEFADSTIESRRITCSTQFDALEQIIALLNEHTTFSLN